MLMRFLKGSGLEKVVSVFSVATATSNQSHYGVVSNVPFSMLCSLHTGDLLSAQEDLMNQMLLMS